MLAQVPLDLINLRWRHKHGLPFSHQDLEQNEHECVLLNVDEVIFGFLCAKGGDRLVVPSFTRVDILVQAREGVSKKAQCIIVPFQDAGKDLPRQSAGNLEQGAVGWQ